MEVVLASFHVIGEGLSGIFGKGEKFRIRMDPWVGCGTIFHLPQELVEYLHSIGKYMLNQTVDEGRSLYWHTLVRHDPSELTQFLYKHVASIH